MADVCRDAGLSTTASYPYFANKEALFVAAVDEDVAGLINDAVSLGGHDTEPEHWGRTMMRGLVDAMDEHPLARRIVSGLEPEFTMRLLDIPALAELRKTVTELIRVQQAAGLVRRDIAPEQTANGHGGHRDLAADGHHADRRRRRSSWWPTTWKRCCAGRATPPLPRSSRPSSLRTAAECDQAFVLILVESRCAERQRVTDREDGEMIHPLGGERRHDPGHHRPPVVSDYVCPLHNKGVEHGTGVSREEQQVVRVHADGLVRLPITPLVGDDDVVTHIGQGHRLAIPVTARPLSGKPCSRSTGGPSSGPATSTWICTPPLSMSIATPVLFVQGVLAPRGQAWGTATTRCPLHLDGLIEARHHLPRGLRTPQ